jgi:hypothetical protein
MTYQIHEHEYMPMKEGLALAGKFTEETSSSQRKGLAL